jgi:hypothetical protein
LIEKPLFAEPSHAALGGFRRRLQGLRRANANGFAIELGQPRDQSSVRGLGAGFLVAAQITHARSSCIWNSFDGASLRAIDRKSIVRCR